MSSIFVQMMEPGGGVVLIPMIKITIGFLVLVCATAFFFGVARIHMAIMSVLGSGLILSLIFFESEWAKVHASRSSSSSLSSTTSNVKKDSEKTD